MFEGYLTATDVDELTNAAISGDVFEFDRALWLEHVRRSFVVGMKLSGHPLQQFKLDLAKLNSVERLEDSSVPLEQFLADLTSLLRKSAERKRPCLLAMRIV